MSLALRPYMHAGVALVGTGVIALTPVTAPPAAVHVPALPSAATVELTAFTNPLDTWVQAVANKRQSARPVPVREADSDWATIFNTTSANATWLAKTAVESWGALGQQLVANWTSYAQILATGLQGSANGMSTYLTKTLPAAFQDAFDDLAAGQVYWAVRNLVANLNPIGAVFLYQVVFPLLPAVQIPITMAQNVANVVKTVMTLPNSLLPLLSAVTTQALEVPLSDTQKFVDRLGAGDAMGALKILANAPARFTDALLNGYIDDPDFPEFRTGGLLAIGGFLSSLAWNVPLAFRAAITPTASSALAPEAAMSVSIDRTVALAEQPRAIEPSTTSAGSTTAKPQPELPGSVAAVTIVKADTAAPTVDDGVSTAAETGVGAPAISESAATQPQKEPASAAPKARPVPTPSQAVNAMEKAAAKAISTAGKQITSTTNKIGEDLKKTFTKPRKPTKTDTSTKPTKSDSDGSGSSKSQKASSGASK